MKNVLFEIMFMETINLVIFLGRALTHEMNECLLMCLSLKLITNINKLPLRITTAHTLSCGDKCYNNNIF